MDQPQTGQLHCPECGAELTSSTDPCWLCGRSPTPASVGSPFREPVVTAETVPERTFGLSSLFMVMTLIAVCLGVGVANPGLGVIAAIVISPALVRTWIASSRRKAAGRQQTTGEKVGEFVLSTAIAFATVMAVGVAALMAFLGMCTLTCALAEGSNVRSMAGDSVQLAIILGLVAGLLAALGTVFLLRRIWKIHR